MCFLWTSEIREGSFWVEASLILTFPGYPKHPYNLYKPCSAIHRAQILILVIRNYLKAAFPCLYHSFIASCISENWEQESLLLGLNPRECALRLQAWGSSLTKGWQEHSDFPASHTDQWASIPHFLATWGALRTGGASSLEVGLFFLIRKGTVGKCQLNSSGSDSDPTKIPSLATAQHHKPLQLSCTILPPFVQQSEGKSLVLWESD